MCRPLQISPFYVLLLVFSIDLNTTDVCISHPQVTSYKVTFLTLQIQVNGKSEEKGANESRDAKASVSARQVRLMMDGFVCWGSWSEL